MRQCLRCKHVKFWFQMYSIFMGTHTATYEVCKSCANRLRDRAVQDYQFPPERTASGEAA